MRPIPPSTDLHHVLIGLRCVRAAIDNHRVLHGRSAFDGARRMCGAYIGGDEFRSRLAVLRERFAPGAVARATAPLGVVDGRRLWDPAL